MKYLEIKLPKKREKNILREVIESYRKLPIYQDVLIELLLVITHDYSSTRHIRLLDENDAYLFNCITDEIKKIKSRVKELENAKNNSCDGGDHSPNP